MQSRALLWAVTLPLVASSVIGGHALAYAATGVQPGPMHGYLQHAPQVVLVLTLIALLAAATEQRLTARFDVLPFLAPTVFAAQEHLERYVHSGHVGLLLTDRTFLLGLALQVPLAIVIARVSHRLVSALGAGRDRSSRSPRLWCITIARVADGPLLTPAGPDCRHRPVRGPPLLG